MAKQGTTYNRALTVSQVCEKLNLSPRLVYELARVGELPARKVGNVWRFSERLIDEWLEGNMPSEWQD